MRDPGARGHKLRAVAALVCDLDGVLTSGGLPYGPDGDGLKTFCTRDNVGFRLAAAAGWPCHVVTARRSPMAERWAADLGVVTLHQDVLDKAGRLRAILDGAKLTAGQVAYLGDDLLDLPAMRLCGLAAAPADAAVEVRKRADLVLASPGGRGALRELVEQLLEAQQRTDEVLRAYFAASGVAAADIADLLGAVAAPVRIGFAR